MNIRPLLQLCAHSIGRALGLLPLGKRYAAAHWIALAIAPAIRRSRYYARRPSPLDGAREESLRMLLRTMTRAQVEFEPEIEFQGRELVPDGGCLIVSGHFLLNIAMTRWVFDAGRRYVAALGGLREPMYYFGTTVPLEYRYSSPQMFLKFRKDLSEGCVCFLSLDTDDPHERSVVVDTAAGRRYVSPSIFSFAHRMSTPVVFAATHLNAEGRLIVAYERPAASDPAAMTAEFCEFMKRHIAAIER